MTRGRPIGKRVREACETLERLGPSTSRAVCSAMDVHHAANYCARAVEYGLATCEGEPGQRIYMAKPNWREIAAEPRKPRPKKRTPGMLLHAAWGACA